MDGLEAVEMKLSEVLSDNENRRLDSEYFKKDLISFLNHLDNLQALGTFVKKGYRVVYENTYIIDREVGEKENHPFFLQATDIQTPFIETKNLFYVDTKDWVRYPMGRISKGEILIEVKGKAEKVAIVPDDFPEKTLVSGTLYKLTVNEKINKHYLLAYLITKYGEAFKNRYKSNLLISYINKEDLYRIPVPIYSFEFQRNIERIYTRISKAHNEFKSLFNQAENLLLDELGLHNWQPTQANTEVKSFKNSFLQSGRLDAEYYQPKYDQVEFAIKNKAEYFKKVAEIRTFNFRGFQPEYFEEGDLDVINSKHILDKTLDYNSFEKTQSKYWEINARARVFKNDILTYTTGANIGRTHAYLTDKKALASNHVNILRITEENPIYIAFVMNSILGRLQTEKLSAGSAQQELYPKDIDNFLIPFISTESQEAICNSVLKSLELQRQSKQLLESAKQAVEIAIEEGEEKAMEFIKAQTV